MLDLLEKQQKLTVNQWKIAGAATLGDMLDFFDFFLIGFVLAFIVKDWNLTYGQSGAILLAWRQRAVRLAVLRLARRQDRPPHRTDPQHPQRVARHRCDGADPDWRLDVPGVLPIHHRLWRHWALLGGHHPDAGVFAGP